MYRIFPLRAQSLPKQAPDRWCGCAPASAYYSLTAMAMSDNLHPSNTEERDGVLVRRDRCTMRAKVRYVPYEVVE